VAGASVTKKKGVPVFHVEAELRNDDRPMPEEDNRVLTDQLSELLFTTERGAHDNLAQEGVAADGIHFVGNVMIDSLMGHMDRAVVTKATLKQCGVEGWLPEGSPYGVVTLHRPSNVDRLDTLTTIIDVLDRLSTRLPLVFPVHPRTAARLQAAGIDTKALGGIAFLPPVGYLEMLGLMKDATLVLTDSGGMQEETTALGVQCLTLRESTERPITVSQGTNTIVGSDPARIEAAFDAILESGGKSGRRPELWDGSAAERIARIIDDWMSPRRQSEALSVVTGEPSV